MNITRLIGLGNCACCSIAISKRSDMMLCNRVRTIPSPLELSTDEPQRQTYARIPYAFLGMVGRAISDSEQCATPTEVKGYWTWDDAFQSWTLYVLGAGSPLLEGPMTCAELLEPEEANATAPTATPSAGLVPASPTEALDGAKGSPAKDHESVPKAAVEPSGLESPAVPRESLAAGYPPAALSGAKSSSTGGAKSKPKMAAEPSELANPAETVANPLQESSTSDISPKPSGRRRKWPHILKPLGPY